MRRDELGLLRLVFLRHLLGVAAGGLGLPELLILDGEELRPERLDLLLDGRADVGRGDDRPEPARRRDRLEPGDADAHDEDPGGRHGAGGGHHHREGAAILGGGIEDGAVAGEVRLRGQDVHHLGPGDARHQLHGEGGDAGVRQRPDRGLVAVGVHDRDDDGAALQPAELA